MAPVFVFTGLLVILQPFHSKDTSMFLKGSIMEVIQGIKQKFSSIFFTEAWHADELYHCGTGLMVSPATLMDDQRRYSWHNVSDHYNFFCHSEYSIRLNKLW